MARYPDDMNLLDGDLAGMAEATGRRQFILVMGDDGTWSFGAPSMLSYSPRPGQLAMGAVATEAMRAWVEANREGVEDA